jgi:hypothetical protein
VLDCMNLTCSNPLQGTALLVRTNALHPPWAKQPKILGGTHTTMPCGESSDQIELLWSQNVPHGELVPLRGGYQ